MVPRWRWPRRRGGHGRTRRWPSPAPYLGRRTGRPAEAGGAGPCPSRSLQRELGCLGQRQLAGDRPVGVAARVACGLVTAKMRSGSNERMFRSPGRPPTTSTDSVPLCRLRTWARNSHVAPGWGGRRPPPDRRAAARSRSRTRSRCSEASRAARRAGARGGRLTGDRRPSAAASSSTVPLPARHGSAPLRGQPNRCQKMNDHGHDGQDGQRRSRRR